MRYLYDLINKQTRVIDHHGITCAKVSEITGIPQARVQWAVKLNRAHPIYEISPTVRYGPPKTTKEECKWWTDQDTLRWEDRVTAAELLRNGGHIVGEGKRKHVVLI